MFQFYSGIWCGELPINTLLHVVFSWAMKNGYFLSSAREGTGEYDLAPTARKNEPATSINWYCAVIWCNALTEYYNDQKGTDLLPVYLFDGEVARTIAREKTDFTLNEAADGFRLPTMDELELAARFKGNDDSHNAIEHPVSSGHYWTPGNYASGAIGIDEEERMWYRGTTITALLQHTMLGKSRPKEIHSIFST